jgi:phage terminase large subunit-like protein
MAKPAQWADSSTAYFYRTAPRKVSVTAPASVLAAALYEQGRVHHIGAFPELEDQMCQYDGSSTHSPDRMDALVWALAALFEKTPCDPRIRPV